MRIVLAVIVGATLSACPSPPVCNATTCSLGCCDASGFCRTSSVATCGANGSQCSACRLDETCSAGSCQLVSPGVGGGSSGGGTPGGVGGGTGGASTGGGTAGGLAEYDGFVQSFVTAYCSKLIQCGQLPEAGRPACAAVYRQFLVSGSFQSLGLPAVQSIRAGTAAFDAAKGRACLTELANVNCTGSLVSSTNCQALGQPRATLGGRCEAKSDCIDSALSCNGASCARVCSAGGRLGEGCRSTEPRCDSPYVCLAGQCREEPAPGTPCQSFSGSCGPTMLCRSGVCERLPSVGQACLDFQCVASASCEGTLCRARKNLGAPCQSSSECFSPAFCRSTCTAPGTPGATCRNDFECEASSSCFSGQCRTKGTDGARCRTGRYDCQVGLQCDDATATCRPPSTVATGQPCSNVRTCAQFGEQCRNHMRSTDGGAGQAGVCGLPMVGDLCSDNSDCGNRTFCDSASRRCVASADRSPCLSAENCRPTDYCTSAGVCGPSIATGQLCDARERSCASATDVCLETSTGARRCGPMPALGEPCVAACQFPYACRSGRCVSTGQLGEPCLPISGNACITGVCANPDGGLGSSSEGTCSPPRANGQACFLDEHCASGSCDVFGSGACRASCG